MINKPRGTVDITPDQIDSWHYIEREIRSIMEIYLYNEIRTPIFEKTELFERGVGEGTDIVTKEMYTFEDKGGRSITLRPEGTASVVRSYIEGKCYGIKKITKLYYIAPMFRYERPQAGRLRQHHQFGVEALGSESPEIDVEVMALVMHLYKGIGLDNLDLRLNSVGCGECRKEYVDVLKDYLMKKKDEFCRDCRLRMEKNPMRVLDCKAEACKHELEGAPEITEFLCGGCEEHFSHVKKGLDSIKINYSLNSRLVRGLDYYTRTTFEVVAAGIGAQDSIAGGGRYDDLVKMLGGPDTPAVGFGAGIERLLATISKFGIEIPATPRVTVFFAFLDEKSRDIGLPVLYECRRVGIRCEMDFFERSLKAQLKAASKINARCVVMFGEEEVAKKVATIRDFNTKEQKEVQFQDIPGYINNEYIMKGICS